MRPQAAANQCDSGISGLQKEWTSISDLYHIPGTHPQIIQSSGAGKSCQMSARCLASKALALLVLLHMLAATAQAHSGRSGCHAENDVCVIGAGGSGMRAAVALRDRGYRVLVLERQNRVRRQIKAPV